MENMALILMLAVTAEGLVEYGKSVGKAIVERQAKTAVTQIGAVIVSVLLCFAAGADLYAAIGVKLVYPWDWGTADRNFRQPRCQLYQAISLAS